MEARIALAAEALATAEMTRNKQRQKALCEQAMNHLRAVVRDQLGDHRSDREGRAIEVEYHPKIAARRNKPPSRAADGTQGRARDSW